MDSAGRAAAANPFKMPTDEEVFILRDEEKRQKAAERLRMKHKSVVEKTTAATSGARHSHAEGDDESMRFSRTGAGSLRGTLHADVALPAVGQRVKDNMSKYIAKKRKLGLDRMALATKRQEIKKLDEEAERAEKRITQMEEQLKETKGKFRAFLQHSEMEQVEAFKRAEHETKLKQDKQQTIKKLSAQIQQIETDRKKNEEQLAQCLEFKHFLDQLTDPKWVAATLATLKKEDARAQIHADLERKFNELAAEAASEALAGDGAAAADADEAATAQMQAELEKMCATANAAIDEEVAGLDDDERWAQLNAMDPERVPMYFTDPEQILKKFMEIEEGNLFLIETCQSYEEEIEKVRTEYKKEQDAKKELAEIKKAQKDDTLRKIAREEDRMKALQERIDNADRANVKQMSADGKEAYTQDEIKRQIESKVREIYQQLRKEDMGEIGTLGMLTAIEVQLNKIRAEIHEQKIDDDHCRSVMKEKDKKRRGEQRAAQVQRQKEQRMLRSQQALERSQADVKKRVGKPVMWRSRPLDHRKTEEVAEVEENEDDEFFL